MGIKEEEEKAKDAKVKADTSDKESEDEDGTWSKTLGDSISSFFGDKDKEGQDSDNKDSSKDADSKNGKNKDAGDKKKEKDEKKKKEKEEKKKKEAEKKKEKPKEPKIIHIKEPLEFESRIIDLVELSKDQFNISKEKLHKLDEIDRIKQDRETALNDLESFVLNVREKLYEDIYEKSSTEDERRESQGSKGKG